MTLKEQFYIYLRELDLRSIAENGQMDDLVNGWFGFPHESLARSKRTAKFDDKFIVFIGECAPGIIRFYFTEEGLEVLNLIRLEQEV